LLFEPFVEIFLVIEDARTDQNSREMTLDHPLERPHGDAAVLGSLSLCEDGRLDAFSCI
jgi:hypothetical protein